MDVSDGVTTAAAALATSNISGSVAALPERWDRWCELAAEEGVEVDLALQKRLLMMETVAASSTGAALSRGDRARVLEKARDQEVVGPIRKAVSARHDAPKRPSVGSATQMRDLDVQVRYAMTWDDKVAPMSVNILREFMRSLCSAEEHLPKSFSRCGLSSTRTTCHPSLPRGLHRVPSNGSSSDARRLLNIDRLPFPRRAFGDFTSWLERAWIRVASRAAAAAQLVWPAARR